MSKACIIHVNNPISKDRHPSLLGYMLTQLNYDGQYVEDTLDAVYDNAQGNSWGVLKSKKSISPNPEPDAEKFLGLSGIQLGPRQLAYMQEVQRFYDDHGMTLDEEYNITQLEQFIKDMTGYKGFAFEIEIVDPNLPVGQRTYKLTPITYSNGYTVNMLQTYELEMLQFQAPNQTSKLEHLRPYLDLVNPDVFDTIAKIVNDPNTPLYQKEILRKLSRVVELNPDLGLSFFKGATYTEKTDPYKDGIGVGRYSRFQQKVLLNPLALASLDLDTFRRLFIHELVHAATLGALMNPQNETDRKLLNGLVEAYKYYRDKYSNQQFSDLYYGLSGVDEFASEFLSNPEFRDLLEKAEPEYAQNIFERIWEFLLEKLGLNKVKASTAPTQEDIENLLDNYFEQVVFAQDLNLTRPFQEEEGANYQMNPMQIAEADEYLKNNSDFETRLASFLEGDFIDWRKIFMEANNIKINLPLLYKSEEALQNISVGEAKEAFSSLVTYFHDTAKYLRSLQLAMDSMSANGVHTDEEIFRQAYHARELGEHFKQVMREYTEIMGDTGTGTVLNTQIRNIEALANSLTQDYFNKATKAIAKKLAKEIAPQTESLRASVQANITQFEKNYETAVSSGNNTLAQNIKNKIAVEKKKLNDLATEENLAKAFSGKLKDINVFSLYTESAALTGNIITGTVGSFLTKMFDEANAEAIGLERKMRQLGDRLEKITKLKGGRNLTGLDFESTFGPYIRKVKILEIKKGELTERETLVFNTEMDEIAYQNDKITLIHAIQTLKNDKNQTPEIKEQIKKKEDELVNLQNEFEERPFIDEYYRIQDLLTEEAKNAREEVIEEMRKIQASSLDEENNEEELDKLEDLKLQLDRLESDTDIMGVLKDEKGLRIAASIREWKKEKNAAELYKYELTENNRNLFNAQLRKKKSILDSSKAEYDDAVSTQQSPEIIAAKKSILDAVQKDYDVWRANNAVRKISPEFYTERRAILESIAAIQAKINDTSVRPVTEIWDEMFGLLKGFKNSDNIYDGTKIPNDTITVEENGVVKEVNIPIRIAELEKELEDAKEAYKELTASELDRKDRAKLRDLFSDLAAMQEKVYTPAYEEVYNSKVAELRVKLSASNPSKYAQDPTGKTLTEDAREALLTTDWYKMNHKKVYRYNDLAQTYVQVDEPLFYWMTTEPFNKDYISYNEPSFRWKTITINPAYRKDVVTQTKRSKRVALNPTKSKYQNPEYAKLSGEEKELLKDVLSIYNEMQKGTPRNLKKGIELPSVMKEGFESLGNKKFGTIGAQIKGTWSNLMDNVTFQNDEDRARDDEGSMITKVNRRLFLRYNSPIAAEKMSVNFINSLAMYGTDLIRFKKAYANAPYLYGIQDVLNEKMPGSRVQKMVTNLFERKLQGKSRKTMSSNKAVRALEWGLDKSLGVGAELALSLRLPSSLKNFGAGTINIFEQLKTYDISKKDVTVAMAKNAKHLHDLFRSYVEDGVDSPYIQKMRYFNIMVEDHLSESGKRVYASELDKASRRYNPFYMLSFVRTFGEFEMRSGVAEAMSKQFSIEMNDGTFKPIMEAYIVEDGVMKPDPNIKDIETFIGTETAFRQKVNAVNSLIHGAYSAMDKGEYSRYTLGRWIGYMKGWFTYQFVRRFATRRMSYGAGMEHQGYFRTLAQAIKILFQNRFSLAALNNLMTPQEKSEAMSAVYDMLVLSVSTGIMIALNSLVYSDDDDDEDVWGAYFLLYNLLLIEDELNTLNPVFGTAAIIHSRVINNVDGKSIGEFYLEKNLILPIQGAMDAIKLTVAFVNPMDDVSMFDEYIERSRTGKILNPKRYKPDPTLKGQYELFARLEKLFGLSVSANYATNPEFIYRKYESRNPRWFIETLDSELKGSKSDISSIDKQIKSMRRQIDYVEDPDTKASLNSQIEDLEAEKDKIQEKKGELIDFQQELLRK
jgi:hypothetical protein